MLLFQNSQIFQKSVSLYKTFHLAWNVCIFHVSSRNLPAYIDSSPFGRRVWRLLGVWKFSKFGTNNKRMNVFQTNCYLQPFEKKTNTVLPVDGRGNQTQASKI